MKNKTTRLFSTAALAVAMPALLATVQAQTIAQFTDFSGNSPYSANVLGSSLNSASLSGSGFAAVATGGNPGSYVSDSSGANWSITLDTADGLDLSTLTFDYQRGDYFESGIAIDWSYSINGGPSTSLPSTTTLGEYNTTTGGFHFANWGSGTLNLSSIGELAPDSTVTLDAVFASAPLSLDNIDVNTSSITPPAPVPDAACTMPMLVGVVGLVAGVRARLRN